MILLGSSASLATVPRRNADPTAPASPVNDRRRLIKDNNIFSRRVGATTPVNMQTRFSITSFPNRINGLTRGIGSFLDKEVPWFSQPDWIHSWRRQRLCAVAARIALDWMIEGTSIDPILDEVSGGTVHAREFLLGHFVQVMCDVACGFPGSFLRGVLEAANSTSWLRFRLSTASLAEWNPAYPPPSFERPPVEPANLSPPLSASCPSRSRGMQRGSSTNIHAGTDITLVSCGRLVQRPCPACRWLSTS